jgi:hypothetical protein
MLSYCFGGHFYVFPVQFSVLFSFKFSLVFSTQLSFFLIKNNIIILQEHSYLEGYIQV